MDLFYGTTFEENILALKKDIKLVAEKHGKPFGKKKVYVAYGSQEDIGNCFLFVAPPLTPDTKPFQDKYSQYLFQTANEFGLSKIILTSSFLVPLEQVSKNDIKSFGSIVEKIVEIFQPKLIVVLGEDAQFSFVRRKNILRDNHGQIIARSQTGVEVMLSYAMSYYVEKSEYQDPSYKNYMRQTDWTVIAKYYKERIEE